MKKSQNIVQEELSQLGINLEHKPGMPYSVPGDYFEEAKNEVLATISALDFVEKLPQSMPQAISSDYFENNKEEMLKTIAALDFADKLPKDMPQSVPTGYFEENKRAVIDALETQEQKSPLTVTPGGAARRNWALAATMALLVSIGLFFMNPRTSTSSIEDSLSTITTEELNEYIEEHSYDFEALDILENPASSTAKLEDLEEQILNETKTMTDEEIFEYVL